MKIGLSIFGVIAGLFLLVFLANEFEIFGVRYWGVRKEDARREVFEQTQSYVEGKRQELVKLHHEWGKASKEDKPAIEATIRHSFSNFDPEKIQQQELRNFLEKILYN